jgi:GTP diphosphokinase / guanosine-3',5'-bis(diphosphate) 3'-diphosphatase
VDGLTKIGHLPMASREERQVESYRKLLLSVAKDVRVILVKLADRLHNMRTLEWMPEAKRQRIAMETRDLYAPMAHRFGLNSLKAELEDLAFKWLEPDEYRALAKLVAQSAPTAMRSPPRWRIRWSAACARRASSCTKSADGPSTCGPSRRRWRSAASRTSEIYDLYAIRVLVENVPECYHALGVIHGRGRRCRNASRTTSRRPRATATSRCTRPSSGRGARCSRSRSARASMHRTAEYGIAAHWKYKDGEKAARTSTAICTWFRQVLELQLDAETPDQFLEFLKLDLYQDEIFVFTPTAT